MLVDDSQEKGELARETPEQILKEAVLDTRRLDEDSQKALMLKDGKGFKSKLQQRALVVVGLPEKISQATSLTGLGIPDDEMATLNSLKDIAQKALERGNAYELGLVLTDTLGGTEIDKPNLLEQLVYRLYPQKPK